MEGEDLVPCDNCHTMVEFTQYGEHMMRHGIQPLPEQQVRDNIRLRLVDGEVGVVELDANTIFSVISQFISTQSSNTSNVGPHHHGPQDTQDMMAQYTMITFSEPEEIQMDEYEFNSVLSEIIGNANIGIPNVDMVCRPICIHDVEQDDICPICREYFLTVHSELGGEIVESTCKHKYCKPCLITWLQNHKKCPVCMLDLAQKND